MEETIRNKWNSIISHLRKEFNIPNVPYETWLKHLELFSITDEVATISVNKEINNDLVSYIENHYGELLKISIYEMTGYELSLEFKLKSSLSPKDTKPSANKSKTVTNKYPFLNPMYTFDSFIVGKNNQFAHAGALATAESPGKVYNPLFIYGGVGLGKTHLMHSIAWYIVGQNPNMKILYTTSEVFTSDVITAIMQNKSSGDSNALLKLKEKYRNVDVLLIDDIQFIIGKESTQEEFFHTFNALKDSNKQIVISSDRPPIEIKTLEERLRSRFSGGLTADISTPDYETRMAILKKRKEKSNGVDIGEDVLNYIANTIKSNIRELDGAFTKLVLFSKLHKKIITLELAEEVLKDIISPNNKVNITVEYVNNIVSEHFNIPPDHLLSSKRSKEIAYPRQICMYLCRTLTDLSYVDIGRQLGNRDHSTVLHGYNKIKNDLEKDEKLLNTIEILNNKINPQ